MAAQAKPRFRTNRFRMAVLLILRLGMALPLHAQVSGGTVGGTVRDQSGALMPDVSLSLANVATGVTRAVVTNARGFYSMPNLLPGVYQITATASGFAKAVTRRITVTVGGEQTVDLVMQVGSLEQSVDVTGASPVEQSSSALSGVLDSRQIVELPLNGRDWTALATLQPGVANIRTQPALGINAQRGIRGLGTQLTISGNRPQQNNYRLDGISINDYSNGAPGSVLGLVLGVDAVQEFSVVTSNAPANYGRSSGGIMNAVTRSGSNTLHGSAYELNRDSSRDNKNFFDRVQKPPFTRNQFGVSAGLPIARDKTFLFADYEGLRQDLGVTLTNTVPSGFSHVVSKAPITLDAVHPRAGDTNLGFVPGRAVGGILVAGVSLFQGGLGGIAEFDYDYNSFQLYDDGFLTTGSHSFKFGAAAERLHADQLSAANPNGIFAFGSLANFLTDRPISFSAPITEDVTPRRLRQTLLGAYVMDDWRLRRNLTVNLGLRYEIATVTAETDGKLSTLVNLTDTQPKLGSPFYKNPTLGNLEPRVGFSWDPFASGKTAVRGAVGVYDHLPLPYEFSLITLQAAPFFQLGTLGTLAPGTFPSGAYPLLTGNRFLFGYVEQKPKRNYVLQW